MAVSKVRKKRPSKPVKKPATLPKPEALMEQLLVDTARIFRQRAQMFEKLATEFPTITGLTDSRIKMQVVSLALVDAIDATAGRPMTYETMKVKAAA